MEFSRKITFSLFLCLSYVYTACIKPPSGKSNLQNYVDRLLHIFDLDPPINRSDDTLEDETNRGENNLDMTEVKLVTQERRQSEMLEHKSTGMNLFSHNLPEAVAYKGVEMVASKKSKGIYVALPGVLKKHFFKSLCDISFYKQEKCWFSSLLMPHFFKL